MRLCYRHPSGRRISWLRKKRRIPRYACHQANRRNDRLAPEIGVVELFHQSVESVNVRVNKAEHGYHYESNGSQEQSVISRDLEAGNIF